MGWYAVEINHFKLILARHKANWEDRFYYQPTVYNNNPT